MRETANKEMTRRSRLNRARAKAASKQAKAEAKQAEAATPEAMRAKADARRTNATTPEIFRYIKFRAEKEGVGFDLGQKFFKKLLASGVRRFFGCETTSGGTVVVDHKQPEILAAFRAM